MENYKGHLIDAAAIIELTRGAPLFHDFRQCRLEWLVREPMVSSSRHELLLTHVDVLYGKASVAVDSLLVGMIFAALRPADPLVAVGLELARFAKQLEDLFPTLSSTALVSSGFVGFTVDPLTREYLDKLLPIFPDWSRHNWRQISAYPDVWDWHRDYISAYDMGAYLWKTKTLT